MVLKKVLIAGDSFAADWPGEYLGWPNLLKENFTVTNTAQAGVSEYKIWKQLENIDFSKYDHVIVSHTSPSRLHTKNHPLHKNGLHKNCDLIYTDIEDRISIFNPSLRAAQGWFRYHYDDEYQIDIYKMIRKTICSMIPKSKYISITHTQIGLKLSVEPNNLDFSEVWLKERGTVNHYTKLGNEIVSKILFDRMN